MEYDLNLPTYEELLQIGLAALPEGTDRSENTFYYPIASAFALMGNELMISEQIVYNKMHPENLIGSELDSFVGSRTSLTRRAATRAMGEVTFTGNVGIYIPQGVKVAAGDQEFVTMWGDTIKEGGTVDIQVQAVNIGNIGYIAASTIDEIVSPVTGVTGVTNAKAMVSGMDEESDKNFYDRYVWHLHHFPYNLNEDTIREWAYEVDGVGQVRVIGSKESRSFTIYALDTNWKPAGEELITELQATLANRLFYGFSVLVTAPVKEPVPITITVLEEDEALQAAVTEALEAYINTYPDPSWVRNDLTVWEVINVVEGLTNMDNVFDIKIADGSSATYTLSATDGSKLLSIGTVTVQVKS